MKTEKLLQSDAARKLGISRQQICNMLHDGKLSSYTDDAGRRWIVVNKLFLNEEKKHKK